MPQSQSIEFDQALFPEPTVRDDWYASYIYYASNNAPLLVEGIMPLVNELRSNGLIEQWFFIRYWMEGPHLRFRVKPRHGGYDQVRELVDRRISAFLATRPALYQVRQEVVGDLYKDMFLMEGTEEEWEERYGEAGMPIRESNTIVAMEYEPEYEKYGGPLGLEISHEHFEDSSDLVLWLLDNTNTHVRPVLFGLAMQLMAVGIGTFLPQLDARIQFLEGYQSFWERLMSQAPPRDNYEDSYRKMVKALGDQLPQLWELSTTDQQERLPGFLSRWGVSLRRTRDRLDSATTAGRILLPSRNDGVRRVADDLPQVMWALLMPYLHMTNNRLGVSIVEEVYLAYLLQRHLSDS